MRVTQSMMTDNAIKWIQQQSELLSQASEISAAGKQINRPSDDPYATKQIMGDRTTISQYAQYMSNISEASTWIEASNTNLESVSDLLSTAEDSIKAQSSWGSTTVSDTIATMEDIYDEIVDLANTQFSSVYMYGGNNGTTTPFTDEVSISGGAASNIVFGLAASASTVTVTVTDSSGNVLRTLTPAGGTAGTNTISWNGCDSGGSLLSDGTYSFNVSATDSSGNAVAEYASYRGDSGGKSVIIGKDSTCTLNNNGGGIFTQALSSLSQAITALKNSTYSSDLSTSLGKTIGDAITQIQSEQVTLANVESQITATNTRLDDLTTTVKSNLSTVEVGDTEAAAVKLTAQENNYETTMAAISKVLKMSTLKDFLS